MHHGSLRPGRKLTYLGGDGEVGLEEEGLLVGAGCDGLLLGGVVCIPGWEGWVPDCDGGVPGWDGWFAGEVAWGPG